VRLCIILYNIVIIHMKGGKEVQHYDKFVGKEILSDEESKLRFGDQWKESGEKIKNVHEALAELYEKAGEPKKDLELEKSDRDREIIELVANATDRFLEELGRNKKVSVPLDHIHYLKEGGVKEYTHGRLGVGSHASVLGEILVDRRNDLETAITTFHELWHAKVYTALQTTIKGKFKAYREGFSIYSREGDKRWYYYLDEALAGYMTKRFFNEVLERDESFKKEIQESKKPIDTTRLRELADFSRWVHELWERNRDQFKSKDEIVKLFLDGQVNGRILPIARLVEKTYGKEKFRQFGVGF